MIDVGCVTKCDALFIYIITPRTVCRIIHAYQNYAAFIATHYINIAIFT